MRLEIKTKKGFRNPVHHPQMFKGLSRICSYDEETKHLILLISENNEETFQRLHSLKNTDFLVEGETPVSVEIRQLFQLIVKQRKLRK